MTQSENENDHFDLDHLDQMATRAPVHTQNPQAPRISTLNRPRIASNPFGVYCITRDRETRSEGP